MGYVAMYAINVGMGYVGMCVNKVGMGWLAMYGTSAGTGYGAVWLAALLVQTTARQHDLTVIIT